MYNRQKWEPKKNGNADPEHMNCTHKHNTHRITSEFSTCSKLMRFLSMSSSVPLFCYIKMYYVSLFYRAIFSSSFVLDFFSAINYYWWYSTVDSMSLPASSSIFMHYEQSNDFPWWIRPPSMARETRTEKKNYVSFDEQLIRYGMKKITEK